MGRAIDRNGLKSPMKMVNGELFAGTVGWKLFFLKSGSIFQGLVLCFGEGLIAGGLSSCLLLVFPFKDNMP